MKLVMMTMKVVMIVMKVVMMLAWRKVFRSAAGAFDRWLLIVRALVTCGREASLPS